MSKFGIAQRIDAVVAAAKIGETFRRTRNWDVPGNGEPWMIIGCLREKQVSESLIRKWLDVILSAELPQRWERCWMWFRVAEIEQALGLGHDPRSAEALAARANDDAWKAYCFPPEPREEVTIAIPVAEAARA